MLTRLGKGSFGEVYSAKRKSNNKLFAVKFEKYDPSRETKVCLEAHLLGKLKGSKYVTKVHVAKSETFGKGSSAGKYYYIIMDLLGSSLNDLFKAASKKFDARTCCLVGQNMIRAI